MNEFDLIAHYFAPLATGKEALGLRDDAAVLQVPAGHELIITKDALVAGVHFIGDEPADLIARKSLRVNLSDLAAMGASPYGYFLALMLPQSTDEAWLKSFAQGLRLDQEKYGITLMGGDTTHTNGPLCVSITALGLVPVGHALRRSGAKAGDDIYISGTMGDAALGLQAAQRGEKGFLLSRYRLPEPRVALGEKLRGVASACMDISDGLAQDLGHICECSGVGAQIDWQHVPLSAEAKALHAPYETILAGGDDYELLFTAPPSARAAVGSIAATTAVNITRIGVITLGDRVQVRDGDKEIALARKGYRHF